MNTNLNCNCPKPQFGMAIRLADNNVQRALKSRVKSLKDVEKLNDIFKKQKENSKVNINLHVDIHTNGLMGSVYSFDGSSLVFHKCYLEKFFSRFFDISPVKFIKKLAKVADKEEARIIKKEEILNKMNF